MRKQTKFKSDTLKASEDIAAHSSKLGIFTNIDRSRSFQPCSRIFGGPSQTQKETVELSFPTGKDLTKLVEYDRPGERSPEQDCCC